MQQRPGSVGGKLRGVKCRGRQAAERERNRFRRQRAHFSGSLAANRFGQERSARDRSGAAAAEKTRFRNFAIFEARGELQDIAAHRVADFHAGVRAGKFAGVARISEMIENSVAEHRGKYGKTARSAQRRFHIEAQATGRAARNDCATLLLFRWKIFFVNGGNDHVIGVDHFGEMKFADFREQLIRVEVG